MHRNRRKGAETIVVMRTDGKDRRAIRTVRRHRRLSDSAVMLEDLDWQSLQF